MGRSIVWNPLAFGLLGFASGSDVNALVSFKKWLNFIHYRGRRWMDGEMMRLLTTVPLRDHIAINSKSIKESLKNVMQK